MCVCTCVAVRTLSLGHKYPLEGLSELQMVSEQPVINQELPAWQKSKWKNK